MLLDGMQKGNGCQYLFHFLFLFSVKSVAQEQKNEIISQLQTIKCLMKKRGMDCPPLKINGTAIYFLEFENVHVHTLLALIHLKHHTPV